MFNVRPSDLLTFTVGSHDISVTREEAAQLVRELVEAIRPTLSPGDPLEVSETPPPDYVTALQFSDGGGFRKLFRREDNPDRWEWDDRRSGLYHSWEDGSVPWGTVLPRIRERQSQGHAVSVGEVNFGR